MLTLLIQLSVCLSVCAVGPWFVGEVLAGRIGACFLYGFVVSGTFVPTVLTYVYGAAQVSLLLSCLCGEEGGWGGVAGALKRWGIAPGSHCGGTYLWCQSSHQSNAGFLMRMSTKIEVGLQLSGPQCHHTADILETWSANKCLVESMELNHLVSCMQVLCITFKQQFCKEKSGDGSTPLNPAHLVILWCYQ